MKTMYMETKKVILVDNPKESLLKFINEHFALIMPYEVMDGFSFQIRLSKEQYNKITKKEKEELKSMSEWPERENLVGTLEEPDIDVYIDTRYWKHTESYVYDYHIPKAFILSMRCVYGHEGLDDCIRYVFVDMDYFEPIIMANIDKAETDVLIRPKPELKPKLTGRKLFRSRYSKRINEEV